MEFLPAGRSLEHQAGSREREHDHSLSIFRIERRACGASRRSHLGAHFEVPFLKMLQGVGGLEEDDFVESSPTHLRPEVDLAESGFTDRFPLLIDNAISVFSAEDQTALSHIGKYRITGRTGQEICYRGVCGLESYHRRLSLCF